MCQPSTSSISHPSPFTITILQFDDGISSRRRRCRRRPRPLGGTALSVLPCIHKPKPTTAHRAASTTYVGVTATNVVDHHFYPKRWHWGREECRVSSSWSIIAERFVVNIIPTFFHYCGRLCIIFNFRGRRGGCRGGLLHGLSEELQDHCAQGSLSVIITWNILSWHDRFLCH